MQGAIERAGIPDLDRDVLWLEPNRAIRSDRKIEAAESVFRGVGRFVGLVVLGAVASGLLPGSALAPVSKAHAAVEATMPSAPIAKSIAVSPVFATSDEEREADRLDRTRDEVEEFLRFGSREVPRRLVDTIVRAAAETGVDAVYLMALADKESSFRPDVKAGTSSAEGLFQFVDRTWLDVVRRSGARHGLALEADAITIGADNRPAVEDAAMRQAILDLRRDPFLAAVMAAELLKSDSRAIGLKLGRSLNRTELYLAHFLGLDDAARFIAARNAKRPPVAARLFAAAAKANAAIFYKQGKRGRRGLSVDEVYDRIAEMIDTRAARYVSVASADPDSTP